MALSEYFVEIFGTWQDNHNVNVTIRVWIINIVCDSDQTGPFLYAKVNIFECLLR